MSIEAMNAALKVKTGSPSRKLILLVLANMANQDGECWPSVQYISDRTELSRSTVLRHLKTLEEQKIVQAQRRKSKTGQTSNLYVIDCSGVSPRHPPSVTMTPPPCHRDTLTVIESIFIKDRGLQDEWRQFLEARAKLRRPATEHAQELLIKHLQKLEAEGNDPGKVLRASIMNSWQGLFPLKRERRALPKTNEPWKALDDVADARLPEFCRQHGLSDQAPKGADYRDWRQLIRKNLMEKSRANNSEAA